MYCGWRPIQRVFRLKRRKRALIGREQTTGSAGGSDYYIDMSIQAKPYQKQIPRRKPPQTS